jgi:cytidylate kinase
MAKDGILLETDHLSIVEAVERVLENYQRFIQFSA